MGRLVDIDSLKGCAIIKPTSHESIEHIKQCGDDILDHNDIPTAYNVDAVVKQMKEAESVKNFGSVNSRNLLIPLNDAVAIVRKGGVE